MVLEHFAMAIEASSSTTVLATAVRFRLGSYSAAAASDQCFSSSSFGLATATQRPARLRSTVESFLVRWVLASESAAATLGQRCA